MSFLENHHRFAAAELPLVGEQMTLRWQLADEMMGSSTSLTDSLGAAIFTVTAAPGDVRYWVEISNLESNGSTLSGRF